VNASSSVRLDLIRQGAITALACWLAVVLAFFAHLDNPWWAAISAWVIAHPERQVRLGPDSFFIWSIALLSGIFLLTQLHHSASRWAYVGTQGGVAFILALITGSGPPNSILPAVDRIAGMLCGVLILLGVCRVIGHPRSDVRS